MLDVLDWRRRTAALYAEVRAMEPHPGWLHWRTVRGLMFLNHAQSPARVVPSLFDYDPSLRFAVATLPAEGPVIPLPAGEDGTVRARPFARTVGLAPTLGRELTLFWLDGYGGGLFLPFLDATGGRDTFAGGRYLIDTIKGADLGSAPDGRLIVDFNFAYNPSCAYADRFACPLSPPENRLTGPVRAGERLAPAVAQS